jgi:hypothetical protein
MGIRIEGASQFVFRVVEREGLAETVEENIARNNWGHTDGKKGWCSAHLDSKESILVETRRVWADYECGVCQENHLVDPVQLSNPWHKKQ